MAEGLKSKEAILQQAYTVVQYIIETKESETQVRNQQYLTAIFISIIHYLLWTSVIASLQKFFKIL